MNRVTLCLSCHHLSDHLFSVCSYAHATTDDNSFIWIYWKPVVSRSRYISFAPTTIRNRRCIICRAVLMKTCHCLLVLLARPTRWILPLLVAPSCIHLGTLNELKSYWSTATTTVCYWANRIEIESKTKFPNHHHPFAHFLWCGDGMSGGTLELDVVQSFMCHGLNTLGIQTRWFWCIDSVVLSPSKA